VSSPGNDHESCGQNAAPYVLGALTDAEHEVFVAHLQSCTVCREEVAALQVVADALPSAVPQLSAPAEIRHRVMATVQADAGLRAGAGSQAPSRRGESRWGPWRLAVSGVAAAAVVALLAVLAAGGFSGGGGGEEVIRAQVPVAGASASLRISSGHGELTIARLPQSPKGHVYEVWVKRAGLPQPTDALFTVDGAGDATVVVPGSLAGVKVVMVTAEPLGGSRLPTGPPVITATIA
jgi:anti-sigma-K factor RskA